jgi:hypothetical protein
MKKKQKIKWLTDYRNRTVEEAEIKDTQAEYRAHLAAMPDEELYKHLSDNRLQLKAIDPDSLSVMDRQHYDEAIVLMATLDECETAPNELFRTKKTA